MKNFLFSVACGGIVGTAVLGACYAGERFCRWLIDKLEEPDEKKNPDGCEEPSGVERSHAANAAHEDTGIITYPPEAVQGGILESEVRAWRRTN